MITRGCLTKKSNAGNGLRSRFFLNIKIVLQKKLYFESFQTMLLCILGELAEGGSVAVAVGVSDM